MILNQTLYSLGFILIFLFSPKKSQWVLVYKIAAMQSKIQSGLRKYINILKSSRRRASIHGVRPSDLFRDSHALISF